jgi:hypothetical protein
MSEDNDDDYLDHEQAGLVAVTVYVPIGRDVKLNTPRCN